MLFFGRFSFVLRGRGLATLLLFLYVTEEARRKCVQDMPWPLAAECNMITNKQTNLEQWLGPTFASLWKGMSRLKYLLTSNLGSVLIHCSRIFGIGFHYIASPRK
jgi:hypothetical protein